MHPILLDLGTHFGIHWALPSYGLLVATALVIGWYWFLRSTDQAGLDHDRSAHVLFSGILGGIIGAKLGLVVVEFRSYWQEPSKVISADFLTSAGVIWAGVIGATLTLVIVARRERLPIPTILDAAAVPLPICQAIGRFGCLLAGCCYGAPTSLPWGIKYHNELGHERTGVPLDMPLHPTPLYEALFCLSILFPVLLWVRRRQRFAGETVLAYFVIYASGRALIEITRGDSIRGTTALGLSTSQLISVIVIPIALLFWLLARRRTAAAAAP